MTRRPTLDELARALGGRVEGDGSLAPSSLEHDSRAVRPGALFVALRGGRTDGHRHAADAVRAGAAAVALDAGAPPIPGVPCLRLADTRTSLAALAARFYGEPGRELTLVGVTGTNGKSSTVRMIESIAGRAGRPAGSIGTISARCAAFEHPASLTTPEATDLQRVLRQMREAGTECVALEVSSHALDSARVGGLRFAAAVFTNLTQDHLDHHGDMASYAAAKAKLFSDEYLEGSAVLNAHDPFCETLAAQVQRAGKPLLRYGRGAQARADVRSEREELRLAGSKLALATPVGPLEIELPLVGAFQVDNALAATAAALALGIPGEAIARGLGSCPLVPGRLERAAECEPVVLVDYAHTPDALERMLASLRPLAAGRLICVFGCGGDRDPGKRAPMARAVCASADLAIATSDNPRSEDPRAILREVERGLSGAYEIVVDRREAIGRAIALARPQDLVVIAGKGHEDYQIVGAQRLHFDDREEARAALRARGALA